MNMKPMKTLTWSGDTYEIVDENARLDIEKLNLLTEANFINTTSYFSKYKANTIKGETQGVSIQIEDSANAPLLGLKVYGKSTQNTTTGIQLFNQDHATKPESWESGTYYSYKCDFEPNTTYTLSMSQNNMHNGCKYPFAFYVGENKGTYENNEIIGNYTTDTSSTKTVYTFTTTENPYYLNLYSDSNSLSSELLKTVWTECFIEFQIQKGDVALPYEIYTGGKPSPNTEYPQEIMNTEKITIVGQDDTQILNIPYDLSGILVDAAGNYTDQNGQQRICDYIDFETTTLSKKCVELQFTGNENWEVYNNADYYGFCIYNSLPFSAERRMGICNQLTVIVGNDEVVDDSLWLGVNDNCLYVIRNSFYDDTLEDYGLANWKSHLAKNPLKILTYLDEPAQTLLTSEEMKKYNTLHTNYPTTTISNNSGTEMVVKYSIDTKLYIDKAVSTALSQIVDGNEVAY